jgi:hypothetical protein
MAARRPVALAGVLLSLAMMMSACASDPPATTAPPSATVPSSTSSGPAPTTTTSAPPTTTQVPVDPVVARIPKAARAHTQEGAEAFGKYFIEQVAQSGVKADPTLIKGLFSASCRTCANFVATAQNFKDNGEHHAKPAMTVESSSANTYSPEKKEIAVWVRLGVVDILGKGGAQVGSTEKAYGAFVLSVTFDEHWVVHSVQVEEY